LELLIDVNFTKVERKNEDHNRISPRHFSYSKSYITA